ncbi:MAG: cell division protein ZapA [Gammaproteobacteria bacterium]|nr:cell division protein ZapA [Gammaproteobacteria bacterium]
MKDDESSVVVTILDKEYRFACDPQERDSLIASAHFLDGKMREIRKGGKLLGSDGLAVMAALNIAHELLGYRAQKDQLNDVLSGRIRGIQEKIESALNDGRQMEL